MKIQELHGIGAVEAELGAAEIDRLGIDISGPARHAQHADVARHQAQQDEHEQRRAEQRRESSTGVA